VLHDVVSGTPEAQTACEQVPPPPLLPLLEPLLLPLLEPLELPLLEPLLLPLELPLLELVLPLELPELLPLLLPLLEPLLLPLLDELLLVPPARAVPFGVPHPVGPSYPTPAVHSMLPQLPFLPEVTS
jgi:hypothetical protein